MNHQQSDGENSSVHLEIDHLDIIFILTSLCFLKDIWPLIYFNSSS